MLTLAFKNVLRRKGIAVLALLGIGPGSALILTLLYLSSGLNRQRNETVSAGRVSPKDALFGRPIFQYGHAASILGQKFAVGGTNTIAYARNSGASVVRAEKRRWSGRIP